MKNYFLGFLFFLDLTITSVSAQREPSFLLQK